MKEYWHPLKLAGLLYMLADSSLLLGGLGYDNRLLAMSGICGLIGNAGLLLGGSGAVAIRPGWLARIAPYAERLSLLCYMVQYLTLGLSGALMYSRIVPGETISAILGAAGSCAGIFVRRDIGGLKPYQLAGGLWLASACVLIWGGLDSGNAGVAVGAAALVLGAICVMLSHRAEFADDRI